MAESVKYDFDGPLDAPLPVTQFPEGLATFTVVDMKRSRKEIKNKGVSIGTCCVAEVILACVNVDTGEEDTLDYELVLESSRMFRLWEFFTAIGQRAHGEEKQFTPQWNKVIGSTGFLSVKHQVGKKAKDDGTFPVFVNISKFMNAEDAKKWEAPKEKEEKKLTF